MTQPLPADAALPPLEVAVREWVLANPGEASRITNLVDAEYDALFPKWRDSTNQTRGRTLAMRNRLADAYRAANPLPPRPATPPQDVQRTEEATCRCGATFVQTITLGFRVPLACAECRDRAAAAGEMRLAEREREQAEERRRVALHRLNPPPLYAGVALGTFRIHGDTESQARQSRILQLARRFVSDWEDRADLSSGFPQAVILRGGTGTGKGHIAWAIALELASVYAASCHVAKCSDIVRRLRASWGRDDEPSEGTVLTALRSVDLLVIDEVSEHALHNDPGTHLYDLIDHRQEWLRPTLITTNETKEGIARILRPALVSRVSAWAGLWEFGETDYRPQLRRLRAVPDTAA